MATLFTTAETGTNGTAVAANTSYGGDAFTVVSRSTGSTITVDTTTGKMAHGTKSYRFVPSGDTGTAIAGWGGQVATATFAFSAYFNFDALPGSNLPIMQPRSGSDGQAGSINVSSTGKIVLLDQGANTKFTGSTSLSTGTTYRISWWGDATNASGSQSTKVALYQGDSTTPLDSYTSTTHAFGSTTSSFSGYRVGKVGSAGTAVAFDVDDIRATFPATDLNGPEQANPAPSANAGGAKTTTVGSSVTLNGSGTGTGTLSYQWAFLNADGSASASIANTNTANASVTPSAGGVLRYQLTVTDSASGQTATDVATVYATTTTVRPIGVTSNPGSWTTSGSTDAASALADSDPATYTQSPDSPTSAATERIRLAPLTSGSNFTMSVDHQLAGSGTGTAQVTLYEGNTVRKVWSLTPTTSLQTATLTLTSTELAAINSLNALDVEFSWSA